jgi:hypothetical protein
MPFFILVPPQFRSEAGDLPRSRRPTLCPAQTCETADVVDSEASAVRGGVNKPRDSHLTRSKIRGAAKRQRPAQRRIKLGGNVNVFSRSDARSLEQN